MLLRNVGSGDGIANIATENGEEVTYCSGAPIILDSETVPYARTLAAVVDYVAELARFSLDKVSVRPRSGNATLYTSPSGRFELRILPSGEARLAVMFGASETVRRFTLDARTWHALRERLASLLSGQRRFVGEENGSYFTRKLAIRLDEASLSLAWPHDWAPPADWSRDTVRAELRRRAARVGPRVRGHRLPRLRPIRSARQSAPEAIALLAPHHCANAPKEGDPEQQPDSLRQASVSPEAEEFLG